MKQKLHERVIVEGSRLKTIYCYSCECGKWKLKVLRNKEDKIIAYRYTCINCGNVVID